MKIFWPPKKLNVHRRRFQVIREVQPEGQRRSQGARDYFQGRKYENVRSNKGAGGEVLGNPAWSRE